MEQYIVGIRVRMQASPLSLMQKSVRKRNMSDDNLSNATVNFDKQDNPDEDTMESIFTVEEDFDPMIACSKLINREDERDK